MKIIVCMKQVPAGTKVDIDPENGAMKRLSGDTRTNPYDLFALETALSLWEKLGGTAEEKTEKLFAKVRYPVCTVCDSCDCNQREGDLKIAS